MSDLIAAEEHALQHLDAVQRAAEDLRITVKEGGPWTTDEGEDLLGMVLRLTDHAEQDLAFLQARIATSRKAGSTT